MSNRRELRGNGKCKHSVKSNHIWSKLMYARFVSFLWETTLILFYEHASNLTDLFRCRSIGMLIIHCESENRTWTRQECVLCVNSQLSQMMSRGSTLSQRDFFRISRSCSLVAPLLYLYCFQSVFFVICLWVAKRRVYYADFETRHLTSSFSLRASDFPFLKAFYFTKSIRKSVKLEATSCSELMIKDCFKRARFPPLRNKKAHAGAK